VPLNRFPVTHEDQPMILTVKDLRAILERYPDEAGIVMSADAEGNTFSPLCEIYRGRYVELSPCEGEFRVDDEDNTDPDGVVAVALWPIN
jgi:hypothetical protein